MTNPRRHQWWFPWLVCLQLFAVACGGASGPSRALESYANALRAKDYGAAYEMMSSTFRASTSKDAFIQLLRENPQEVEETARRLRSFHERMEISAELVYGIGDRIRLSEEGGSWVIASNPVGFYDASSPRNALRSFVRAYRLRRWEVMLRFVPSRYREQMDVARLQQQFEGPGREETERMMAALEQSIDAPITEQEAVAHMPYGERYEVKFLREDGEWKLADLD